MPAQGPFLRNGGEVGAEANEAFAPVEIRLRSADGVAAQADGVAAAVAVSSRYGCSSSF